MEPVGCCGGVPSVASTETPCRVVSFCKFLLDLSFALAFVDVKISMKLVTNLT